MLLGDSASSLLMLSSSPDARVPGTPVSHEPSPRGNNSSLWSTPGAKPKSFQGGFRNSDTHTETNKNAMRMVVMTGLDASANAVPPSYDCRTPGVVPSTARTCAGPPLVSTSEHSLNSYHSLNSMHSADAAQQDIPPSPRRGDSDDKHGASRVVPQMGPVVAMEAKGLEPAAPGVVGRIPAVLHGVAGGVEGLLMIKRGVSLCPRCCTPAGSLAASGCAVCVATWAAHSSLVTAGHPSAALLFRSLILTGFSDTSLAGPVRFASAATSLAELHVLLGTPEPSLGLGSLSLWRSLSANPGFACGFANRGKSGGEDGASGAAAMREAMQEAMRWAHSVSVQGSLPDETEAAGILAALRG